MKQTRFFSGPPLPCNTAICYGLIFVIFFSFFLFYGISSAQEYTVGEGDVLDINVYENDDLSTTVRVSSDSTIRVPLLGEISVKQMTVSQISAKIEKLLADGYLVNPQVDVFISEHRSKKAIILGQIKNPGQYELRGRISFLEFISKAGGLTNDAGDTATVERSVDGKTKRIVLDLDKLITQGDTSLNIAIQGNDNIYISKAKMYYVSGEVKKPDSYKYEKDLTLIKAITMAGGLTENAGGTATLERKGEDKTKRIVVDLDQLITKGDTSLNIPIYDDDVITISEAKTYYVNGEVKKPNSYKYEKDLTVIKAITMAGGFSKIAAKDKVSIIRLVNGTKKIFKNVKMDEPVLPDDVIVVPESFF